MKVPKVNRVVKFFILADLLFFAGWGFVNPIFSVFIVEGIEKGSLIAVGISTAIYWVSRSVIQPFVAIELDKRQGEKDDLYALMLGLVLAGVAAFLFASAQVLAHIYAIQVLNGLAHGTYSTPWSTIFSGHLDKKRRAFDWALDKSAIGMAVATTGFAGAWLASTFGFDITFFIAGSLSLASAAVVFIVPDLVLPPPSGKGPKEDNRRHLTTIH